MLNNNQTLKVHPADKSDVVLSLYVDAGDSNYVITRRVEYMEDLNKFIMAIEAAIIYLQKKAENCEF